MKPFAQYSISFGLDGCYLPDSHYGTFQAESRRELVSMIQNSLSFYDLPKSLIRTIKINKLWAFIKNYGSSSAHFSIYHKGYRLSFSGLTESEFNEQFED